MHRLAGDDADPWLTTTIGVRSPRTAMIERIAPRRVMVALATMALATGAGVAMAIRPETWVLIVVLPAALLLLVSPTIRLSFVVLAGVLVLGPAEFGSLKLLYLGGVLLGLMAASQSVLRSLSSLPEAVIRLLGFSAVGLLLLGLVAAFRLLSGTDGAAVLRDLVPYLLLALAPVFAIDAGISLELSRLQSIAAVGLAAGTVAFLLSWTARRGILVDQSSSTVFGGFFMPITLLILAAVCLADGRLLAKLSWSALAGLAAATAIVTGTRSFVLEIPAVVLALAATGLTASARWRRVVFGLGVVVAAASLLAVLALLVFGIDERVIVARWSTLILALSDPMADGSLAMRLSQTDAAWRLFLANPVFGVASGLSTGFAGDYIRDTPIALFAGYGLLGIMAVASIFIGWVGLLPRVPDAVQWPRATLLGMLAAGCTFALILPIVEDKGLGFSVLLIGAPLIRTLVSLGPTDTEIAARGASGSGYGRHVSPRV